MTDLYVEEALLADGNSETIEVVPEMLDYGFVESCKSVDEMRAVYKALKNGKFGRYPDLENTARAKLIELLPHEEKKRAHAITSKPTVSDVNEQKESLQDWLGGMARISYHNSNEAEGKRPNAPPVRSATQVSLAKVANAPIEKDSPPTINRGNSKNEIFRKEKLSTKEYFDRWDKFDVDKALESSDSEDDDDKEDIKCMNSDKFMTNQPKFDNVRLEKELAQFKESFTELSKAERTFMSVRECEKGNEYFKMSNNEEATLQAICCYSKSIILDETNAARSYSNRAAAYIRLSNFDRAIDDCTKALEIDATFVKARARRGMCYHKMERYDEAISDFEACHELEGNSGYKRLIDKSKEKLREKRNKLHPMLIEEVDDGSCSPNCGGFDYVEEIYTPGALESDMLDQHNAQQKASLCSVENSNDNETLKPEASPQAWHKISIVDTHESDEELNEDAITSMRRIEIVTDDTDNEEEEEEDKDNTTPQTISSLNDIDSEKFKEEGNEAMKRNNFCEAVEFYSRALEANPNNIKALNNRTIAYTKLELWDECIADANACIAMEPKNTKALYHRGHAKMMKSDTQEALDDFQLALSFNPPTSQRSVLSKKADKCQKVLLSVLAETTNAAGKEKVRRYDSKALAW